MHMGIDQTQVDYHAHGYRSNTSGSACTRVYYNHRFIVRIPIGLDFLFTTFRLHFFLSWMSSLLISNSDISASTFSNHVFLAIPSGLLISIFSPSLHHFSSSHVHTISAYQSRINSNQRSQFFTSNSVFHENATHPSNHLCLFKL